MSSLNKRILAVVLTLTLLASLFPTALIVHGEGAAPRQFTILHTNDFHGQLEPSGSNPGMARVANAVNAVRTAVGAENVLLVDAGDEMQGSLLSNLWHGLPVIGVFNAMGYNAATLGNHEFDWGQDVLAARADDAAYPYLAANLVLNDTGNCATAGWTSPDFVVPYSVQIVGTGANQVKVGFIGVTNLETPYITIAEATQGLCFKDPKDSIVHYYDELKGKSDVIVVLAHLGHNDGGYGYGITVYGEKTLAQKLIDAKKPVPLIIGGHSHTDLSAAVTVGATTVVQAHYNGRKVGRADITVNEDGTVQVAWQRLTVATSDPKDAAIDAKILEYVNDPDYQALINEPIGYTQVDLLRNYNGDAMMGDFVDDAIYNQLNSDTEPLNDVDMFFNNAGGIRIDWCDAPDPANPGQYIWSSTAADCSAEGLWTHDPMLLTYGHMFQILPFGNATIVGDMTGAQILDLINQSATLFKGAIQPAGVQYKFYRYSDALPGPQPYAWGGFDICVINRVTDACEPLDLTKTYRVGTNEFLAPAGQDGYTPFKYMTNISYWGDMLNAVNAWVTANYTLANPYKGPDGDGTLDGRITRDGTDAGGSIVPVTVLHHNDSHGNLVKGTYVGYTQLAAKITQERAHNPTRTLLVNSGDSFQGDSMMYYFKSAALGYAADGTVLPPALQINPLLAAFNAMNYDAWTLGNHEFNFGSQVFTSMLGKATFPILQANLIDDGQYGLAQVNVKPYVEKAVGTEGIKVAILGIGNHRIPNYELPSNIPGLTFTNPITVAQQLSTALRPTNDVVLALTHIGFTENPASVEVDVNVDTNLAATVPGIDTIIGGHSHTDPTKQTAASGTYKYLPAVVAGPDNKPVLINHAYRYNNTLGEVVLGMRSDGQGGWDVATQAGRYISIALTDPEDAGIQALAQPFVDALAAYNNTVIGQTTVPIDALQAFTQETNGANLQADASVWELETHHSIPVDFHLSGAMTNRKVADAATPASPVTLKVSDMFSLMPYENSLVVMEMNGPQLKAVLERAYRNYYYYKYVSGYGGYSYYTTCMIDTNAGGKITYNDPGGSVPYDPTREYVVSLEYDGNKVDFADATKFYRVSTVNYLAAGSCNFNNSGVSLWPLDQIVNDTQYYVRDAVIYYIQAQGTVSPAIEGRLRFLKPVTLLHTNDFHGNLQSDKPGGRGGSAYLSQQVNLIRAEVGAPNVVLMDAGDIFLGGAPISQLLLGESTIDIYNMIGYDISAIGNHEFDKGQELLQTRIDQSTWPWVSANIVLAGTEWESPAYLKPYEVLTVGAGFKLGVIGVTTDETPNITLRGTTEGLVFKDMTDAIVHYYDEVKSKSDMVVVLAHMGKDNTAGFKGMKTVAQELITAGKPVPLIISGHAHEAINTPVMVGDTAIVQAGYAGRYLGRVDYVVDSFDDTITYKSAKLITINSTLPADSVVADRVAYWWSIVEPIYNQPVGTSNVSLIRNYNGESNMGNLVADGMRWKADMYDDGVLNDSVQVAFTNAGGLRADILAPADATLPFNIKWGDTFNVLPFGNTLFLMDLTGEQIQALLNQSASLYKGILQSSGITWRWYNNCGCSTPTEWSAFDVRVAGRLLDPAQTYRIVTNNFLAPGGDGFVTFNNGTNRWDTYYDMQIGVNEYIQWYNANLGPIAHEVEGRILYTILKAEDTTIRRYKADTSLAQDPLLEVGTYASEPFAGIVHFPVTLPANATIDSASLQLYGAGWSGLGANITVGAYAILRPVTVNEATWNVAQAGNPWAIPGAGDTATDRSPSAEFTLTTGNPRQWYAFDITALVQEWVKGTAANNGMLFKSEGVEENASAFFASKDFSDESVQPRLVIRWH